MIQETVRNWKRCDFWPLFVQHWKWWRCLYSVNAVGTVALEQWHRLDHIIPSKNNNNYKGADCVTIEMLKVVTATSTYCMSSRFPACTFISRNLFWLNPIWTRDQVVSNLGLSGGWTLPCHQTALVPSIEEQSDHKGLQCKMMRLDVVMTTGPWTV